VTSEEKLGLVPRLGVYNEEDSVLLVMELMHQTLDQYLKDHKGRLPLEKQLDICYQVSCGLLFLHQYDPQILHRETRRMGNLLSRFFSHRPDQLLKGEEIGRGAYGLVLRGTLGTNATWW
jgi:serine/threonine protein kinase